MHLISRHAVRRMLHTRTEPLSLYMPPPALARILRTADPGQQLPPELLLLVLSKLEPAGLDNLNMLYRRRELDHPILKHELRQRWRRISPSSSLMKKDLSASEMAVLLAYWDRVSRFTHMPCATGCKECVFVTDSGNIVKYTDSSLPPADSLKAGPVTAEICFYNVYQRSVPIGFVEKELFISIDEIGQVYSWGVCTYGGCLGHGETISKLRIPTPLDTLRGHRVNLVSIGSDHCLAVADSGSMFTWGDSSCGQCGHGDRVHRFVPTFVNTLNRWIDASAGGEHTLAVSTDGRLFSFGGGEFGQLGHGSGDLGVTELLRPTEVIVDGFSFRTAAAGFSHSLAVARDGTVFSWGSNVHGQLGIGGYNDSAIPCFVRSCPRSAIRVAAGFGNSFAITLAGEMYAWGEAFLYNRPSTDEPQLVELDDGMRVVAVSVPLEKFMLDVHSDAEDARVNMHTLILTDTGSVYGSSGDAWIKYGLRSRSVSKMHV